MEKRKLMVNTIYPAFMGEVNLLGIGAPCTFVRLSGCNLRCYKNTMGTLCDTPEALELKCGKPMSVDKIIMQLDKYAERPIICLTGGEPLMQDVAELLEELSSKGYVVIVETNGSISIAPYKHIKNVYFVVDCKSESSGEHLRMFETNYKVMGKGDYLKFVINDELDYYGMRKWIIEHPDFRGNVAVGLFWGSELSYKELMNSLREDRLNVYVNMQTHKMACLYDEHSGELSKLIIPKDL